MLSFKEKIVCITGVTSGIGEACAKQFAALGANLILIARRQERLAALAKKIQSDHGVKVLPLVLDVTQVEQVEASISGLPAEWQAIDVLVNNAGLALGLDKIQDGKTADWNTMIDTNVKGLLFVTRQVLAHMLARNRGHIINIGSISAYQVYSGGVAYCATKFAVRAISEGLKMDVHDTPLRVSSVEPGMVDTEFSQVRFSHDEEKANKVYQGLTPLVADDIADAVVYCATRPLHVDVREIKIYPTAQTASHMVRRQ